MDPKTHNIAIPARLFDIISEFQTANKGQWISTQAVLAITSNDGYSPGTVIGYLMQLAKGKEAILTMKKNGVENTYRLLDRAVRPADFPAYKRLFRRSSAQKLKQQQKERGELNASKAMDKLIAEGKAPKLTPLPRKKGEALVAYGIPGTGKTSSSEAMTPAEFAKGWGDILVEEIRPPVAAPVDDEVYLLIMGAKVEIHQARLIWERLNMVFAPK